MWQPARPVTPLHTQTARDCQPHAVFIAGLSGILSSALFFEEVVPHACPA